VSRTAVQYIKGGAKRLDVAEVMTFSTRGKRRLSLSKYRLGRFDEAVVRRSVYKSYISEKCVPTIQLLRLKLKATQIFEASVPHEVHF
jgi:hypothetical protein